MNINKIQALEMRHKLGELMELAYYQSQQFQIARKDKVMARLVGEPFMRAIDRLMKDEPGIADTIAILLNDEVMSAIKSSRDDTKKGDVRKLTKRA